MHNLQGPSLNYLEGQNGWCECSTLVSGDQNLTIVGIPRVRVHPSRLSILIKSDDQDEEGLDIQDIDG